MPKKKKKKTSEDKQELLGLENKAVGNLKTY